MKEERDDPADLIRRMYAAAGHSEGWPGVVDDIAGATGALSGCVVAVDTEHERGNVSCFANIDPDWIEAYNAHYHQHDPTPRLTAARPGEVLIDHVTGPRPSETVGDGHTFYNEVMVPQGFRHTLVLGLDGLRHCNAGVILQRTAAQGPFTDEAVRRLQALGGHLRQSLDLHARLLDARGIETGMAEALDHAPTAVLLVDHAGQPVFINRRAEALLRHTTALTARADGIEARTTHDNRAFQRSLRSTIAASLGRESARADGLWLHGTDGRHELHVEIRPMPGASEDDPILRSRGLVAVWLSPLAMTPRPAPSMLRELYDLTVAESEVLALFVEGRDLAEISALRGVELETVRTQVKTIMAKLDVSRQVDLVRLVLSGPASRSPEVAASCGGRDPELDETG